MALIAPVAAQHAYRLLNHGPTVLVSSAHGAQRNVMAAAWAMPLDFTPPKVAVVIDKSTATRALVEASGLFAINLPCQAMADLAYTVGSTTGADGDKFDRHAIAFRPGASTGLPLLDGCVAWLECRVLPTPAVQTAHDLFLAEVLAAEADSRVFHSGRWHFDSAPPALRTLHHVAGGLFLLPGEAVQARVLD
jgi:flavin reductase (DIM6/NTAB) family NADH-FMN oxidoreductase RutF